MDNTIFRHKSFTGNFARVHAGIRLSQNTHDFATEAAAVINADPKDTLNWLMLADKLEEEGNPAHHMIRAVFIDGYKVPEGFSGSINRSYYYYEGGSQYSEGIYITFAEGVLKNHYYACGGNWYAEHTPESIREVITREKHARGLYDNLIVTGSLPPTGGIVNPGVTVKVVRPNGTVVNNYKLQEAIPVPLDTCWNYEDKYHNVKIQYRDHTIYTTVDYVKAVA